MSNQLSRRDQQNFELMQRYTGAFRDSGEVSAMLMQAQAHAHVVGNTGLAAVPDGFALVTQAVVIDPQHDTYPIPGPGSKRGLAKAALERIASAAGVSWITHECGRLDDGSDPHYCEYRAVGMRRTPDGQPVRIMGTKVMDLRDGSPAITMMEERAAAKGKDASRQIRELRGFIQEHAESKAKNRAIRSLGVKTAYDQRELSKPFVTVQLQLTGDFQDPELRREYARAMMVSQIGHAGALYGPGPSEAGQPARAIVNRPTRQALPQGDPELGTKAPPPVGATPPDDDEEDRAPSITIPNAFPHGGRTMAELSDDELEELLNHVDGKWQEADAIAKDDGHEFQAQAQVAAPKYDAFLKDVFAEQERRGVGGQPTGENPFDVDFDTDGDA